jgi:cytochrome P450
MVGVVADPDPSLLRDPATFRDPYPVYAALRAQSPLQVGRSSWILLSYDHVRSALADPERFSSNVRASDNPVFRDSPLIFDDPPRHTQIRRIMTKAFTPRRVAEAEPWIRAIADQLLDSLGDEGPLDFQLGYCDPLPVLVIARMMGIPTDRTRDFKQWSEDRAFVIYNSRGERTPELVAAERGAKAITDWFDSLVRDRAAAPGDDLISALVTAEVDGDHLEPAEVVGACCVLLSAGNLTTTRLIGNMMRIFADDPHLWAMVRADRSTIPAFVEEIMRLEAPVQTPIRRTTCDVEMGGKVIPANSFVTIGIGAANHDGAAFADPDEVMTGREVPHLAFGHGIHFCLGAALARLEARVAFDALADRFERFALVRATREDTGLGHRGHRELVLEGVPASR